MLEKDVADNKAIGDHGATEILKKNTAEKQVRVITHCNTGSLATAGYGTALGVIRSLHNNGKLGRKLHKISKTILTDSPSFSISDKKMMVYWEEMMHGIFA